jgi:hypothetical protein
MTDQSSGPKSRNTKSGARPPDPPPGGQQPPAEDDDRDDPRRVAHELVGQAHAVLVVATRDSEVLETWCPEHLRRSFLDARPGWWEAVGGLQAAIASGEADEDLQAAGIGGVVSRHKRLALRHAVQKLIQALKPDQPSGQPRKWMKTAASLARTAIGSLARELPAGEIIAEALDGVISAVGTPPE